MRDHSVDLDTDRITLKWIIQKYVFKKYFGLNWLTTTCNGGTFVNRVMNFRIWLRQFLDRMSVYELLNKDYVTWSETVISFETNNLINQLLQLCYRFMKIRVAKTSCQQTEFTVMKYEYQCSYLWMEVKYILELFINHKSGHEPSPRPHQFRLHDLSL